MNKKEASERWDGYFYLFLGQQHPAQTAAKLADSALEQWAKRYDVAEEIFEITPEGERVLNERNTNSSLPPDGSIFYTQMDQAADPEILSGCCNARIAQDASGTYDNFPICSKCRHPAGR